MRLVYKTFFDGCRELHCPVLCGGDGDGSTITLRPGDIAYRSKDYPCEPGGPRPMEAGNDIDISGMTGYVYPSEVYRYAPWLKTSWHHNNDSAERFRPDMSSEVYDEFSRHIRDHVTLKAMYGFQYRIVSRGSQCVLDALIGVLRKKAQVLSGLQIIEISELIVKNLTYCNNK